MPNIFKEPLMHFFIGGLFLYGVILAAGPGTIDDDPTVIPVNDEVLLSYLQYQDKAFDTPSAKMALTAMDAETRARLESDYIRDEVMVREAKALGLAANDEIIRRRLIQKMDFIMQGFAPIDQPVESAEMDAYFAANKTQYQIDAEASFTHIFFNKEKRGAEQAYSAAAALIPQLNSDAVPFESAGDYGDRFYFLRNYVKRSKKLITDHFGSEMMVQIFENRPSAQWIGPFTSQYGTHLLLLREITPPRTPALAEVADQVLADVRRERLDKARTVAIKKLTEKYTLQRSGKEIK